MFEGKSLMFCKNKLTPLYKKHKKQSVSRINRTVNGYFIVFYFRCNITLHLLCFPCPNFQKLQI